MTNGYPLESILAVDCGSLFTKAILIDVVEGQFRLIARSDALSTGDSPQANTMLGVARSAFQLERSLGRKIRNDKAQLITPERMDGSGVDAFVATTSAGAPLRLFLVGLANDVSISSARNAVLGCSATIIDTLSLEDHLDQQDGIEAALTRLHRAQPDAIVLVGGVDEGASPTLLQIVSILTLSMTVTERKARAPIVYAGTSQLRSAVVQALGDLTEVRVTENIRPTMELENLAPLTKELRRLHAERILNRLPGMGAVSAWSRVPILPTMQAFGYSLGYLSAQFGLQVIGLDVGAQQTTVGWAVKGRSELLTQAGLGMATLDKVAEQIGIDRVLRWLPESCEPDTAWETILNLSLHRGVAPGSRRELQLTQAVARELLTPLLTQAKRRWRQETMGEHPQWDLIILSGAAFARAPSAGQAALIALDTLQPVGISSLVTDAVSLAAPLGAIGTLEPLASTQVLERDAFVSLGTVVAPTGVAKPGDTALRIQITYSDGRALQVEAPFGSLEIIPLAPGQKANLELRPGSRMSLGETRKGRGAKVEVDGGLLGVIVDARGRPLTLPEGNLAAAQERSRQWLWDVGGV
jgi:hypothetical protein